MPGVLGLFPSLSLLLVICLMLLLFFVRVVFLRPSYIALASARSRQQFVHINEIVRADLLWWEYFLQQWNGRMFFRRRDPSFHVFTDASGSYGCGGYFAPNWFSLQWPS